MKRLIVLLLCLSACYAYSHQNVSINRTIGKVQLYCSVGDYTEVMNQAVIIAEYANLILKDLNYKDSIHLYINQHSDKRLSAHRDDKNPKKINFWYNHIEFDTKVILNMVYQICKHPERVKKNRGVLAEQVAEDEQYINQILQNKVYRPDSVEELGKMYGHNYYTQDNRYYFYSLDNKEKVLYQTDKVYQLRSLNGYKLVIFTDDTGFVFIDGEKVYEHKFKKPLNNKFRRFILSLPSSSILTISSFYNDKVSVYEMNKNILVEDINVLFEKDGK